jgi:hypothetical protein
MADGAIVVGTDGKDLHFTSINSAIHARLLMMTRAEMVSEKHPARSSTIESHDVRAEAFNQTVV